MDDLFILGNSSFEQRIMVRIRRDFQVGSEARDNIDFVGLQIHWKTLGMGKGVKHLLCVNHTKAIAEFNGVPMDKGMKDDTLCSPSTHTAFQGVVGHSD